MTSTVTSAIDISIIIMHEPMHAISVKGLGASSVTQGLSACLKTFAAPLVPTDWCGSLRIV